MVTGSVHSFDSVTIGSVFTRFTRFQTREYPGTPETVLRAAERAIATLGWKVKDDEGDGASTSIKGSVPVSVVKVLRAWWWGELFQVDVYPEPPASALVNIDAFLLFPALKSRKVIRRFFAALDAELGAVGTPRG